jgi:cytochrome c551/c552
LKGLDSLIKTEEAKSRERIEQAKGTIEKILDFEHMNYQQKINYLTMFGNVFKGTESERVQVSQMINEEIADLEKKIYEERKAEVIKTSEETAKARIEAAEKEISDIANAERIGVTYRIRYLQNWMQFYEGTAEERVRLEEKVAEEIKRLQGTLQTELETRAKKIPTQIAYKERLDILKNLMQEELEAAQDNLEAQLEIEEKYQELKEEMREDEIENIKNLTSENLDLLSEMAGEMVDALAEGGAGAGIKFLEAMFEGIEGIAQHYMNIYVVEPLLDEIAQATAEFEEQGMSFFDALMQGIAAAISGDWVRATLSAIMLLWNLFKKFGDDILDFFENVLPNKAASWLRTIRYEWGGGLQEDVENLKNDLASAFEADTYEGFVENFRRTLQGRIKDAIINAFLESAMMKPIFEKLAKAVHEAFEDSELTDEEWSEIKQLMDQATGNAKEAFEKFQELFGELDVEKQTNVVKSITEETANVLLAIERSSNLYLREINENIRAMRFLMQGWSFNTPVNVGFETQQTLRSHGL